MVNDTMRGGKSAVVRNLARKASVSPALLWPGRAPPVSPAT
jgi:hypothetical protein